VLERGITAGAVRKIDKARLSNLGNLDPEILELLAVHDPGNAYGVPYTWGTVGIGYNVEAIAERMPNAPVDSLDMFFKPDIAARFADCGIAVLDSPQEVIAIALNYLGYSPYSDDPEALKQVETLLAGLRPHLRYVHSAKSIDGLAQGEICLALAYSGDVGIAAARAAEADASYELLYSIPNEGTVIWFDVMAIPTDAPHPANAHAFIDFLLRPEVIAEVTNFVFYANANAKSLPLLLPEVREDPGIYPPEEVRARLFADKSLPLKQMRKRTRVWSNFR
jgi:putrescine transport system substrate-binding protein